MKEGGISARKAGLLWGLSMKRSTLQVSRLSRRVTFDRRIEVPSPSFFFKENEEKKKKLFADRLIQLANRGFGMSPNAFLKSVKKFLHKEVRIIPFNSRSRSPPHCTYFTVSSPKGLFRNNHYLESLHQLWSC